MPLAIGRGVGVPLLGAPLGTLAKKAGAVMHLDVTDLVSASVIRDKQQGNNATLYNFAGTADSGILNTDSRITQLVNILGSTGNFEIDSNGDGLVDTWVPLSPPPSSFTMTNNVQKFYGGTVGGYNAIRSAVLPTIVGNIMYLCAYGYGTGSASGNLAFRHSNYDIATYHPFGVGFTFASVRGTCGDSVSYVIAEKTASDPVGEFGIKLVGWYDLTAIFGAGNEPSKAEMDKMIRAHYETGGSYIGSTPPALASMRPCIMSDGIDDHLRVLSPSALVTSPKNSIAFGFTIIPKGGFGYGMSLTNTSTPFGIAVESNGVIYVIVNGSVALSVNVGTITAFCDIVAIYNRVNIKLYKNGSLIATQAYSLVPSLPQYLTVGARRESGNPGNYNKHYGNNYTYYTADVLDINAIKKHRAPLCTKYGITYA